MRRVIIYLIILLILLGNFTVVARPNVEDVIAEYENIIGNLPYNKKNPVFVPGEILVKFKEDVNPYLLNSKNNDFITEIATLDEVNIRHGIISIENVFNPVSSEFNNIYKFTISSNVLIAVKEYNELSIIDYAEPNYIYSTCEIPNDPFFSLQWGLNQDNDYDIDALEAWNIETGDADVTIAILDTGVDYEHVDLADNIWINEGEIPDNNKDDDENGFIDDIRGWDFVDSTIQAIIGEDGKVRDNDPMDFHGHGTHCAGIAGGVSNNGIGIAGVCWNAKIMPVRIGFLPENGSGIIDLEGAILGIKYAADNGADVISMSWGGSIKSKAIEESIEYAYSKGVVLVGAAGNENTNKKHYPSALDNVIAVAATDQNDYRAFFSNYGKWVDVAAPGVNINSTVPGGKYDYYSGTSMACPYVAGLAGLILSKNKSLCSNKVRTIIENSVDRMHPNDMSLGFGRINALKALKRGTGNATSFLKSPIHGKEVKGTIDISGTADGEEFQNFSLDYAKGADYNTSIWIELKRSKEPVNDGLLFSLNTEELNEGLHTIKLKVNCKDEIYEDTIWIIVNNEINTFNVDDNPGPEIDHTSIRWAIYDTADKDIVFVYNGTYNESVRIYNSINLIGQNKESTIINGSPVSYALYISSNGATICGLKIVNSYRGVFFYKAINNILHDNIIKDNLIGIKLSYSSKNTIQKNNVMDNGVIGIYLTRGSNRNRILKNNIQSFMFSPIYVNAYFRNSYLNRWFNNYWDDWIGLDIKLLRFKPKRIPGRLVDFFPILLPEEFEDFFHFRFTLRSNYDRHPARAPHSL